MAGRFDLTATQMMTKDVIEGLARMALQVPLEDVRDYTHHLNLIESVGPVLAPGDWMAVRNTLPGHTALAQAFLRFREELEKLRIAE